MSELLFFVNTGQAHKPTKVPMTFDDGSRGSSISKCLFLSIFSFQSFPSSFFFSIFFIQSNLPLLYFQPLAYLTGMSCHFCAAVPFLSYSCIFLPSVLTFQETGSLWSCGIETLHTSSGPDYLLPRFLFILWLSRLTPQLPKFSKITAKKDKVR